MEVEETCKDCGELLDLYGSCERCFEESVELENAIHAANEAVNTIRTITSNSKFQKVRVNFNSISVVNINKFKIEKL